VAADDGSIELQVGVVEEGADAVFGSMTQNVRDMLIAVDGIQGRFAAVIKEVQTLNDLMKMTANVTDEMSAKQKKEALAKAEVAREHATAELARHKELMKLEQIQRASVNRDIGRTKTFDGRTVAQAEVSDQLLRGLITGIDTTAEQLEARLVVAATRATKRLMASVEEAMAAQIRKADLAIQTDLLKYGSSEAANLEMRARTISHQKRLSQIGNAESYDEVLKIEAVRAEEERVRRNMEALNRFRDKTISQNYIKDQNDAARAAAKARATLESAPAALDRQRSRAYEAQFLREERARQREQTRLESAPVALDAQRSRAWIKEQNDAARQEARERAREKNAQEALDRQRSRAYVREETRRLSAPEALDRQRSRAYEAQFLREERAKLQEERKAAREAQQTQRDTERAQQREARLTGQEQARAARETAGYHDSLHSGLTGMIAAGFAIGGVAEAAHSMIELDDAMTRFQALSGASSQQAQTFKSQLLDLASASRFSVTEMADAATHLAQTGLAATEVTKVLPNAMNLAAASGSSLSQSVEVLTSVLGAYNMQASQTGNVANVMVGALNHTRLTIEQLSLGLQYSADIANQMGVSVTELTAVFGGLAQAGIRSGSVLGTAVRQLMREFQNPTQKFQEALHSVGLTLADVDVRTQGFLGVLDNLREHGFGVAEAMRGMEARTVTSYAALMVQEGTIKRLNTELLLYNGAVDGAGTANESLIARMTTLNNTVVGVADKAFSPLMLLLKDTASGLTSILRAAESLGPILPILGTGITSVAIGLGAVAAAKMAAGLTGAAQGLLGISAAAEEATVGVVALDVALGPVGMIAGIAATVIGLLEIAHHASNAAEKLDTLKTSIGELDSRINQNEIASQSLDKSINNLLEKRAKLNDDPLLRQNTIIEMQKQFADLGLTVDANAKSIDSLIEALRKLREEQAQATPSLLVQQIKQEGDRLALLKQEEKADAEANRRSMGGRPQAVFGPHGITIHDPHREAIAKRFGPDVARAYELGSDYSKLPSTDVRSVSNPLVGMLTKLMGDMQTKGQSGSSDYQMLNKILDGLNHAVAYKSNEQAAGLALDRYRTNLAEQNIKATPAYQGLQTRTENIAHGFEADTQAITRRTDLKPGQKQDAIEAAKTHWNGVIDQARKAVEDEIKNLEKAGATPEQIQATYGPLVSSLKSIDTLEISQVQQLNKEMAKSVVPGLEKQINALKKSQGTLEKQLHDTLDPKQADEITSSILSIGSTINDLQKRIIKIKTAADGLNPDAVQSQNESADEETAAAQERARLALAEKHKQITEQLISIGEKYNAAQMHEVNTMISATEKELRDPRTAEDKIKELTTKLDGLFDQRVKLIDDQANAKAAREQLTAPSGVVPTGDVQQRIATALAGSGHSADVQFALRLADHETGGTFDPNVLNKQGSGAKGLFQYMPDTAASLGLAKGKNWSVEEQVAAYTQYDAQARAAFQKSMGRGINGDAEHYAIWQQGGAGAASLLKNPTANAASLIGSQKVLQNGGTLDMTAQQFFDKITEFMRTGAHTKNLRTTADVVGEQADATKREARQKATEDRQSASLAAAQRNARDVKASNSIANSSENQQITDLMNGAKSEGATPMQAITNVRKVANIRLQQLEGALTSYDAQPKDGKTAKENDADRLNTMTQHTGEYIKSVQEGASLIEKAGAARDKKLLKDTEDRLKLLEKSGKGTPGQMASLGKEREALQQRIDYADQLNGKKQALAFIEEQLATARKNGNVDQKELNNLVSTEIAYKQDIADLDSKAQFRQGLKAQPNTVGTALTHGTTDFFASSGMFDPKTGQWKSATDQIAGAWSQMLGSMEGGMQTFFTEWANGTKRGSQAFRDFGVSVVQSMEQIVVKMLSEQVLKTLFGGVLGGSTEGVSGGIGGAIGGIGGLVGSAGTGLASLFGMGGSAPMQLSGAAAAPASGLMGGIASLFSGLHFATGTDRVPGVDTGRDSVPAMLQPGEAVLNQSAVSAVGRGAIRQLNAMGNSVMSKNTAAPVAAQSQTKAPDINIWLAQPDQVPPPGPQDIVHHVANNIAQGGQIKTLIKQVQAGQM
jgi:TP901 family phage tail tape measure protein